MEKRQTVNESREDTANALKKKTNQDFNGKKPLPNDPDMKKETPESEAPETETPGIGDDKKKDPMPDVFAWTGMASAFRKAGFREVARRSAGRPIMRIELPAKKTMRESRRLI